MEDLDLPNSSSFIRNYGVNGSLQSVRSSSSSSLDVCNLSYEVNEISGPWWRTNCFKPTRKKMVLRSLNMKFINGQIAAIVGSSGSGKTSLLDVISCRTEGRVSGSVYFSGELCTGTLMKSAASYVMQADRLLPHLKVRECLTYTAYLKLPGNTTASTIDKKVQQVINDLGLKNVADSVIGGSVDRGISGGERRRVTIAIQLLQDPDILLLDEPTTGLDSFTAKHLVTNLKDLAHSGKIIIMTIHQPRSDIFKLFNQVAILSQGEVTYSGKPEDIVPYFTNINFPCPRYANPIDIYIDVSSINRKSPELELSSTERVNRLVKHYKDSFTNRQLLENSTLCLSQAKNIQPGYLPKRGPGAFRILLTLLSRFNVNLWRDKRTFLSRIFLFPFYVFFVCIFLGRLGYSQQSIQDRLGLLYQAVSSPPFIALINVMEIVPPLRDLYYREARDGLYSIDYFMIAYTLHALPFIIVSSAIFSSALYWICNMYSDINSFGMFVAVITVLYFTGELVSIMGLGLCHNALIANSLIGECISMSCLVSSGFIRTFDSLPYVLQWLVRISMPRYAAEIIGNNEFQHLNFTCVPNEPCGYPTGEAFLNDFFPNSQGHVARNFEIIVGYLGGFFLLSMLAFKVRGIPNLQ
ncbi:ATP-binding cassette sub-family G member 5 isoform X1 [Patella vulgata]|uniref:ATP-binding cassette sub-family G member 5 isoform X1 n=2 Tax=Patella vulgata TaxID=6465 RepID=UPI00217F9139|nr:ATP-binding cassette sub-family G member 5 isoform X1 [Patella vulgata]XP_050406394.1 ATP-binding cassette sub-family G member 5 isoform X1 [Patella vulgata]